MDCEKFDQHVIDAVYEELDELTSAALRRHADGCTRCAGVLAELRSARDGAVLPLIEPSDDLEERILEAVTLAQRKAPWPRKLLRGLAWAGSHAMRPQFAMAALFFFVIGSSLLLLRVKPGAVGAPVQVTERGEPSPDRDDRDPQTAIAPAATAMARATDGATPPAASPADKGGDEHDDKAKLAKSTDKDAAKAALAEALKLRGASGCGAAVGKLDAIGVRFAGTGPAADAMWEAASCYSAMGQTARARELYTALRSVPAYRDRANDAMSNDAVASNNAAPQMAPPMASAMTAARAAAGGGIPAQAAAAPAPAAALAQAPTEGMRAKAAPAKAARSPGSGSPGKATAAPAKDAVDTAF